MITPADIEFKEFTKAVRGYKEEEVDAFLDLIIVDMEKLIRENKSLKAELEKAKSQVTKQISTESSVYETLEAAKSLMNDIAASAERRAEVIIKDAEMEAALITRNARESISRLTEDGDKLRKKVQALRSRYKKMLEEELEKLDFDSDDILGDFERDFLPQARDASEAAEKDGRQAAGSASGGAAGAAAEKAKADLTKTIVNVK